MVPASPAGPFGIELETGERVLYVDTPDYASDKVVMSIIGALLLVVGVGIIFLVMAFMWNRWNPRGNVVTDRRFVHVKGNGQTLEVALQDLVDVDVRRQGSMSGGGLVGVAISAGVNAIANHLASQNPKMDPKFWGQGVAVILIVGNGVRHKFKTKNARKLGPFIVNVLANLSALEQFPSVG